MPAWPRLLCGCLTPRPPPAPRCTRAGSCWGGGRGLGRTGRWSPCMPPPSWRAGLSYNIIIDILLIIKIIIIIIVHAPARFIIVQMENNNYLHLHEVVVFGVEGGLDFLNILHNSTTFPQTATPPPTVSWRAGEPAGGTEGGVGCWSWVRTAPRPPPPPTGWGRRGRLPRRA